METGKPQLLYEPESRNLDARTRAEQWEIHRSDVRLTRSPDTQAKSGLYFCLSMAGMAVLTWVMFF